MSDQGTEDNGWVGKLRQAFGDNAGIDEAIIFTAELTEGLRAKEVSSADLKALRHEMTELTKRETGKGAAISFSRVAIMGAMQKALAGKTGTPSQRPDARS